jgi:hypothetical protein
MDRSADHHEDEVEVVSLDYFDALVTLRDIQDAGDPIRIPEAWESYDMRPSASR